MYKLTYDGVTVTVKNGVISDDKEIEAYVKRGRDLYGSGLYELVITLDKFEPEMVDLEYKWENNPFHRLRRITGYLVGNLGRWNNGKRAEERDRVKHGLSENTEEES